MSFPVAARPKGKFFVRIGTCLPTSLYCDKAFVLQEAMVDTGLMRKNKIICSSFYFAYWRTRRQRSSEFYLEPKVISPHGAAYGSGNRYAEKLVSIFEY